MPIFPIYSARVGKARGFLLGDQASVKIAAVSPLLRSMFPIDISNWYSQHEVILSNIGYFRNSATRCRSHIIRQCFLCHVVRILKLKIIARQIKSFSRNAVIIL